MPKRQSIAPGALAIAEDGVDVERSMAPSAAPSPSPPSPPEFHVPPPPRLPEMRAETTNAAPSLIDHDEHAPEVERFFDAPIHPPIESDEPPPIDEALLAQRLARRRRFTAMARIVVVVSGLLCAFALVRVLMTTESPTARASTSPTAIAMPVAKRSLPSSSSSVYAPASASALAPASALSLAPALALRTLGFDRPAARHERFEAQAALEIGDIRRAAFMAERAVAHDPTEADGWLLLVAAQLDLKDEEAANRSLRECARVATRGPRGECVSLITR